MNIRRSLQLKIVVLVSAVEELGSEVVDTITAVAEEAGRWLAVIARAKVAGKDLEDALEKLSRVVDAVDRVAAVSQEKTAATSVKQIKRRLLF